MDDNLYIATWYDVGNTQMIKIIDYSKKYGSFEAVSKTNLNIKHGEIYALLGPNGGGKTTMFKSIVGLTQPTTGKILIDNKDIWSESEKVKSRMSFLPQRISIPDNLKIKEVINFFASLKQVSTNRINEILEQIDIKSDLNQYVGELSGGMIQRLGLVITFLGDVPIYILDEPTLNLDLSGTKKFRAFIRNQKEKGKTILLSTHALLEAESIADRVGVIAKGKIVMDQDVSEIVGQAVGNLHTDSLGERSKRSACGAAHFDFEGNVEYVVIYAHCIGGEQDLVRKVIPPGLQGDGELESPFAV